MARAESNLGASHKPRLGIGKATGESVRKTAQAHQMKQSGVKPARCPLHPCGELACGELALWQQQRCGWPAVPWWIRCFSPGSLQIIHLLKSFCLLFSLLVLKGTYRSGTHCPIFFPGGLSEWKNLSCIGLPKLKPTFSPDLVASRSFGEIVRPSRGWLPPAARAVARMAGALPDCPGPSEELGGPAREKPKKLKWAWVKLKPGGPDFGPPFTRATHFGAPIFDPRPNKRNGGFHFNQRKARYRSTGQMLEFEQ